MLLNLWYYAVHTPVMGKAERVENYEAKARKLGFGKNRDHAVTEHDSWHHSRQDDPKYAALVESMDENIGRVFDALKANRFSNEKLRVTRFAGFSKSDGALRLSTITGDFFSEEEFINWYGAPTNGWIPPNGTVEDPNNYGSGDGYWVYYFETQNGKTFAAGAQIPH